MTYTFLIIMISIVFLIISYFFQGPKDFNMLDESNQNSIQYFPKKQINNLIDADGKALI